MTSLGSASVGDVWSREMMVAASGAISSLLVRSPRLGTWDHFHVGIGMYPVDLGGDTVTRVLGVAVCSKRGFVLTLHFAPTVFHVFFNFFNRRMASVPLSNLSFSQMTIFSFRVILQLHVEFQLFNF